MASCGPCSFRLGPGMETRGAELNPGHSQDKSPPPACRLVSSSSRDMEVWGQFVIQHCHRKVNTPSQHPRPHLQSEKHLLTLQPGPAMSHSFFLRSTCFPPRRCSHWSGDRVSAPPPFFSFMAALLQHRFMSQTPKVQWLRFGSHRLEPSWGRGTVIRRAAMN